MNCKSRIMNCERNGVSLRKFPTGFLLRLCAFAGIMFLSFINSLAQIAVKGETVWTMAGEPIINGVILVNNGKIEAVGTAAQIKIPTNYKIVSAKV
ncbi:MAG TPA: hypothetical protein VGD05_10440, partial [Pyrinomonadaceae bacterium]